MDKALAFAMQHPLITAVIVIVAFKIIVNVLSGGGGKKSSHSTDALREAVEETKEDPVDEEEKPEMSKITVMTQSGRVVEEFTAETDSIDYDSSDGVYIEFDGADGKKITYMLGTFSVKITGL